MKDKKAWFKILGIGVMHLFLYGYLVPFVIYPRFGETGFIAIAAIALVVSAGIIAGIFLGRKSKEKNNG